MSMGYFAINTELLDRAKILDVSVIETFNEGQFTEPSSSIFDVFFPKKVIGQGTHSVVYQCTDLNQNVFAIKKYSLSDETMQFLKEYKIIPEEFLIHIAKKEFEIGVQISHSNIVNFHNLTFKETSGKVEAYLIMDFVFGVPFEPLAEYSQKIKKIFLIQFLDAMDCILSHSVLPDDLWSENFMINSAEQKLTVIDLGGYEIVGQEGELPFNHYYKQLLHMIKQISRNLDVPEFHQKLKTWKKDVFLHVDKKKPVNNLHLILLQEWVRHLRLSLGGPIVEPQTIHLSSYEEIFSKYQNQVKDRPGHVSFATGQAEKFLAYELIARTAFQKFHPESSVIDSLNNKCFLRYPSKNEPKDLCELFDRFPLREDYDTVSSTVARYLVSVSPSLEENEGDESALAIFRENDRDQILDDVTFEIFREECVSPSLYEDQIRGLLVDFPCSEKGGILTQVFLPKTAPLHKTVYRCHAYGLLFDGVDNIEKIDEFFEDYSKGVRWSEDPTPQLRFLPSAIKQENGFDHSDVRMIRYILLSSEALREYAEKVNRVVTGIFEEFKLSNLQLAKEVSDVMSLDNRDEKDILLEKLSLKYLKCSDPIKALKLVKMIGDGYVGKPRCLTLVVSSLIQGQECSLVEEVIQNESKNLLQKQTLLAQLAFVYLDHGNLSKVKSTLEKMTESPQKNLVLLMCMSQFDDQRDEFEVQLSSSFSTDLDTLMENGVLELELD